MILSILKESNDSRVSLLPDQAAAFQKLNVEIVVESGAGDKAFASNSAYTDKKVKVVSRAEALQADIVLSINSISEEDAKQLKPNAVVVYRYLC